MRLALLFNLILQFGDQLLLLLQLFRHLVNLNFVAIFHLADLLHQTLEHDMRRFVFCLQVDLRFEDDVLAPLCELHCRQ